ncbi:Pkinase-domain-containing protein [Ascobolus immersus RN42]|uniref:non-specific serine/threonine protein kinase n=1 Tax=Ascobolus immersus RN42 TaxID=1160509 RepID=A0A3N4IDA6_ASCIM|nr:Pkinase-domain-containing protein [Ascobolus immersus RN42]
MSAQSPVVVQRQQSTRRTHSRQSSTSRAPVIVRQGPDSGPGQAIATRDPDNTRLVPGAASERSGGHSRQHSAAESTNGHGSEHQSGHHHSSSQSQSRARKTSIRGETGTWILGKTIGAGSMGKVKLARKADGSEQVAVKIVPRQLIHDRERIDPNTGQPYPPRHDESKEIRTAREAAIVTLLDHPYICGMRDVVKSNHHWYMLCEFVNGGQMLDYIISHGRLKEKQARKFARQIASALDYCHRNSIVHRDLKIENILISKTGDIKIIDFGLSNLYAPMSHLKTFCGSLYFAAPELLQAKQYIGPEVDVWSFGIVLYVLVCGKVPFDDQSMPALHAKIKKGVVDYPAWLSADCKHILSRMLVTDPKQRATLAEILQHPWLNKGYSGPPDNYLPQREPLTTPLDPEVVEGMTGFDFGSAESIMQRLTRVVESEEYQRAVRNSMKDAPLMSPGPDKKKGFGFDFYKRRSSTNSRDTLTNPSSEALGSSATLDPFNAYNPLLSIYYLVREKQARDRGQVATGSMPPLPASDVDKLMRIPIPAPPEAAHTGVTSYELSGEPKPSVNRTRPRARTHGDDEVSEAIKKANLPPTPSSALPPTTPKLDAPKKESAATSLLRRFSTRKHAKPATSPSFSVKDTLEPTIPESHSTRKSLSVRRAPAAGPSPAVQKAKDFLTPPSTSDGGNNSSWSSKLGRSTSVSENEWRKRYLDPILEWSDAAFRNAMKEGGSTMSSRNPTSRTKSVGHARRDSEQLHRRSRVIETASVREQPTPERGVSPGGSEGANTETLASDYVKPVYLKGLFSVATTSTKPASAIRADIIRVLKQLGVQYKEIRGGFSCAHSPSIDLKSVQEPSAPEPTNMVTPSHRRRLSFVGGGKSKDSEAEPRKSMSTRRRAEQSYSNSDGSSDSVGENGPGDSLVVQFEIHIVKVPLLSIHGIQFKSVSKNNTWQYKSLASKILSELKL